MSDAEFDGAVAVGERVAASSVRLVGSADIIEKSRFAPATLDRVLAPPDLEGLRIEAPMHRTAALAVRSISRVDVPDKPDRIIAATVVRPGVPLVGRDGRIGNLAVMTNW